MLIDTHCHIDQFPCPEDIVRECENSGVRVVAVTNLPSHFAVAADRLAAHSLVSPALGMHPLFARQGLRELPAFKRMAMHVNFVGEVGLDFSRHATASQSVQERVFDEVLRSITGRAKFVTLHSRGAEKTVLEALRRHRTPAAVFHWFSGPETVLNELLSDGHFVSINPAMLSTKSGRRVIGVSPRDRVLVESDGPFTSIGGRTCTPVDVAAVYEFLAARWGVTTQDAISCIKSNFDGIVKLSSSA